MSEIQHQLLITLVHGTWGRGFFPKRQKVAGRQERRTTSNGKEPLRSQNRRPLWFEEGSPFLARLNTELNDISHKSKPLLWSGKNAIFERDKTAQVLAEYISTEHLEYPKATQLIIAHSHGGNIALRALQHLQKLDAPKRNEKDCATPLVVTLATPFVEIHKADLGAQPNLVRVALLLVIFLLTAALFLAVGELLQRLMIPATDTHISVDQFLALSRWYRLVGNVLMLVAVCSSAALVLLIGWWWLYQQPPVRQSKIKALNEATRLDQISTAQAQRLLIIRAIEDEASLAMALGTIANYATTRGIIGMLALFIVLSNSLNFTGLVDIDISLELLLVAILKLIIVLMMLFGTLIVSRTVHGRELALSPMECQINTQSTPDAARLSRIVTLVRRAYAKSLRHGIYDHEDCAKTISDWVRTDAPQAGRS